MDPRVNDRDKLLIILHVMRVIQYQHNTEKQAQGDMKLENIIMYPDGTLRLIDAGVSANYGPRENSSSKCNYVTNSLMPSYLDRDNWDLGSLDIYAFMSSTEEHAPRVESQMYAYADYSISVNHTQVGVKSNESKKYLAEIITKVSEGLNKEEKLNEELGLTAKNGIIADGSFWWHFTNDEPMCCNLKFSSEIPNNRNKKSQAPEFYDGSVAGNESNACLSLQNLVSHGEWRCLDIMLKHMPEKYLETCLRTAASKGYLVVVNKILEKEVKVDAPDPETGLTPLMLAASSGHVEACQALIKGKASPYITSQIYEYPYQFAEKHTEVMKILMPHHKNVRNGEPLLHQAILYDTPAVLKCLIAAGADVNQSHLNTTPCDIAMIHDHTETLEILVSHGALHESMLEDCADCVTLDTQVCVGGPWRTVNRNDADKQTNGVVNRVGCLIS